MNTLKQAIQDLGIDTPIYRIDPLDGGGLRLHLPGGPVDWGRADTGRADAPGQFSEELPPEDGRADAPGDDLTAIKGVGERAAAKLREAGLTTFEALQKAEYARLVDVVGKTTANQIVKYFETMIPF